MKKFNQSLSAILLVGLMFLGLANKAEAQNKREINDTLNQLNGKLTDFQYNINGEINQNTIDQSAETRINGLMQDLRTNLEDFQTNLNSSRESQSDVEKILNSAKMINDYLSGLRLNAKTLNDWSAARNLLDKLGANYNTQISWETSVPRQTNINYSDKNDLTGTYQLDTSRSDNVSEIAQDAINRGNVQNKDESTRDLQDKLESPQNLAIEVRGNQVVLASTLSQSITLTANGSEQTQTLSDGSVIRLRASLRGDALTISKLGSNEDYTVTFTSIDNGQSLKVSRRVTTDYLSETVFAESVYTKTDSVAQLDIYNGGNNSSTNANYPNNYPTNNGGNNPPVRTTGRNKPSATYNPNGQYVVPNGEIITATLNNLVSTKVSQNNDRFRATVTGPGQFRGAVIEGYVTGIDRASRNPVGTTKITLNFETIRLTNGETYDFAGFLQSVTDTRGKNVKVDEEGVITKGQTKETLKRAGIGAGAGAILGAILGGGKGAIIGATIGAGGGAGSVAVQNGGDVELESGTSISVQSSSPITK